MLSSSSTLFASACLVAALTAQVSAHTLIMPAIGVKGQGARTDVRRPAFKNECGGANPSLISSSTIVPARADGTFDVKVTNFNGGRDGSLHVDMQVDASGTGQGPFVPGSVPKNGELDPTAAKTIDVTAQLPPGTVCRGGAGKNVCLVTFTAAGGFGNCVAVSKAATKRELSAWGSRAARFYRVVDKRGDALQDAEDSFFADDLDNRDLNVDLTSAEDDFFSDDDDLTKRDQAEDDFLTDDSGDLNIDLTSAEDDFFSDDDELKKRDQAEDDFFSDDGELRRRDQAEDDFFADDLD